MFDKPTVFVLGAGASWHYGYPTGEDLIPMVVSKANELAALFKGGGDDWSGNVPDYALRNNGAKPISEGLWRQAQKEAQELSSRLMRANPVVIDYFLAQNPCLHDIGRLAIALVIFDCEEEFHRLGGNPNHLHRQEKLLRQGQAANKPQVGAFNDDWLRFVMHRITMGCRSGEDLQKNDLLFVTFNYDVSVEKRLYDGLSAIGLFDRATVSQFLEGRVVHVYGGVREKIDETWKTQAVSLPGSVSHGSFLSAVEHLNIAFRAAEGIRTIDGPDKTKNQEALNRAKSALNRAESVYILGYGFDASNSDRIGLAQLQAKNTRSRRTIRFTNFGGTARISRPAGRILCQKDDAFVEHAIVSNREFVERSYRRTHCEMSTKDVYGALSCDFEI